MSPDPDHLEVRSMRRGNPGAAPDRPLECPRYDTSQTSTKTFRRCWRTSLGVPPDLNGPTDVRFDPLPADFAETPIFALFEAAAARDPSACALAIGDTQISYDMLRRRALALAQRIDAVAPPDAAVAILLEPSADAVAALLACLAARRVALVLNADHPLERNAAILQDAAAAAVVVAEAAPLPDGSPTALRMAPIGADTLEPRSTWQPPARAAPDAPAIVLYTSGSAGRPKGVVLSQFSMLYRVQRNIAGAHINRGDRMLPLSALGTVNGCSYILAILLAGGTLVQSPLTSLRDLRAVIRRERITALIGLPRLLDMVAGADVHEPLTSLRFIRSTGEAMRRSELDRLRATLPRHCHINITYGMTETSVTHWWVPHDYSGSDALLPMGYPLDGVDFVIVGDDGEPVADGAVGEIVVRSRVVALGDFVGGRCVPGRVSPDPADPTRRIFATGDLVRLRPDGMLQFVARGDRQIKVNGQRVEPAEIEEAMLRFPGVAEAVIVTAGTGDAPALLGFVVPSPGADPRDLHRALRETLRHGLPGIMRPSRLVMLERLPRLPSGKVDRQSLVAGTSVAGTPRGAWMLRLPLAAAVARYRRLVGQSLLQKMSREQPQ
jgi:amino acid adenylation domain-containing protein